MSCDLRFAADPSVWPGGVRQTITARRGGAKPLRNCSHRPMSQMNPVNVVVPLLACAFVVAGLRYQSRRRISDPSFTPTGSSCKTRRRIIRYVRLTWVDYANNPRCRILPWERYSSLVATGRPGIRVPKVVFGLIGLHTAKGFSAIGNWLFVADPDSLRTSPTDEGVATVFGWFQHIEPSPGRDISSPLCPRSILHRVLQQVLSRAIMNLFYRRIFILGTLANAQGSNS